METNWLLGVSVVTEGWENSSAEDFANGGSRVPTKVFFSMNDSDGTEPVGEDADADTEESFEA